MQASTRATAQSVTFEQLGPLFEHLNSNLETITRRLLCVGNRPGSDERTLKLEQLAEKHLDGMITIAEFLCRMPTREFSHIQLKARVLAVLMCNEEAPTIADRLLSSLCRDIG